MIGRAILLVSLMCAVAAPARSADIRIAYNSAWPPYSSGDGQAVTGVLVDLLEEIIEVRLGYRADHFGYPWSRVQSYVEAGELDAFITYPSPKRLDFATRAAEDVFLVQARALVKRGSSAAAALRASSEVGTIKDQRICVMLGDNWSQRFYAKRDIDTDLARDTMQCLKLIARGRMDVFIHTTETVLKGIEHTGLATDLEMLSHVYSTIPLTLLVSKKGRATPGLLERFNDEVRRMKDNGDLSELVGRLRAAPR